MKIILLQLEAALLELAAADPPPAAVLELELAAALSLCLCLWHHHHRQQLLHWSLLHLSSSQINFHCKNYIDNVSNIQSKQKLSIFSTVIIAINTLEK
jgi:hypothetical protein